MNFLTSCINFITGLFNLRKSKRHKDSGDIIIQNGDNNVIDNRKVNNTTNIHNMYTSNVLPVEHKPSDLTISIFMILGAAIGLLGYIFIPLVGLAGNTFYSVCCIYNIYQNQTDKRKKFFIVFEILILLTPILYISSVLYPQHSSIFNMSLLNHGAMDREALYLWISYMLGGLFGGVASFINIYLALGKTYKIIRCTLCMFAAFIISVLLSAGMMYYFIPFLLSLPATAADWFLNRLHSTHNS